MPRDLAGVFTLPPGNPVVSGALIESAWANSTMNDIMQALTDSLDRNGRGGMLAPMKFTDGSAVAPGITFTNQPSTGIHREAAGHLEFGVGGTTRLRVNVSGVVEIFVGGVWQALDITNLAAEPTLDTAADVIAFFDASVGQLRKSTIGAIRGPAAGGVVAVTVKATAGTTTHVFNAAMQRVQVEAVGGGGGGGGTAATAAAQLAVASGGGAGGHARRWMARSAFTAGELSTGISCTVGAAGAAGAAGGNGGNGGNTLFGTYITANGGDGSVVGATSGSVGVQQGASGGVATGGDLNVQGASGGVATRNTGDSLNVSGAGANSPFGAGGKAAGGGSGSASPGSAANGNGAGGSGARAGSSQSAQIGGAGTPGLIMIVEFS